MKTRMPFQKNTTSQMPISPQHVPARSASPAVESGAGSVSFTLNTFPILSSATSLDGNRLRSRIQAARGNGQPLNKPLKRQLEQSLGTDLSGVRLHTNAEADHLSRSVDASAFTTGSDIFFRQGMYRPDSSPGWRLLAHEVTHTMQQAAGPVTGIPLAGGLAISNADDQFERAAEETATRIMAKRTSPEPHAGMEQPAKAAALGSGQEAAVSTPAPEGQSRPSSAPFVLQRYQEKAIHKDQYGPYASSPAKYVFKWRMGRDYWISAANAGSLSIAGRSEPFVEESAGPTLHTERLLLMDAVQHWIPGINIVEELKKSDIKNDHFKLFKKERPPGDKKLILYTERRPCEDKGCRQGLQATLKDDDEVWYSTISNEELKALMPIGQQLAKGIRESIEYEQAMREAEKEAEQAKEEEQFNYNLELLAEIEKEEEARKSKSSAIPVVSEQDKAETMDVEDQPSSPGVLPYFPPMSPLIVSSPQPEIFIPDTPPGKRGRSRSYSPQPEVFVPDTPPRKKERGRSRSPRPEIFVPNTPPGKRGRSRSHSPRPEGLTSDSPPRKRERRRSRSRSHSPQEAPRFRFAPQAPPTRGLNIDLASARSSLHTLQVGSQGRKVRKVFITELNKILGSSGWTFNSYDELAAEVKRKQPVLSGTKAANFAKDMLTLKLLCKAGMVTFRPFGALF